MATFTDESVLTLLRNVQDPEIPVNIVELGLIYGIHVEDDRLTIQMTLTTKGCPMSRHITGEIERVLTEAGASHVDVSFIWDPPWSRDMMEPEARKKLGWEES